MAPSAPEQEPVAYVPEEHDPPTEVYGLNGNGANGHHPEAVIHEPAPVPAFFAPAAEPIECWVDPSHADPPAEEELTPEPEAIAEPEAPVAPVELPDAPIDATAEAEAEAEEPAPVLTPARRWPKLSRRGMRPQVNELPELEAPTAEPVAGHGEPAATEAEATAELLAIEATAEQPVAEPEPFTEAVAEQPVAEPEPFTEAVAEQPVAEPFTEAVAAEPVVVGELPSFAERGRIRRRARYLRQLRELQMRDIGGFALELHRFGRRRDELVDAKVAAAAETDRELRELERALTHAVPLRELREAGIGGACTRCGAVHGSADSYCAACGMPLAGAEPAA